MAGGADLGDEDRVVKAVRVDAHSVERVVEQRLGRVKVLRVSQRVGHQGVRESQGLETIARPLQRYGHFQEGITWSTSRSKGDLTEVLDISRQISCMRKIRFQMHYSSGE